jgi:putative ABC transport system ATP-binding protein
LINDPAILIADEPTAHLDRALSASFISIVERFKNQGRTVLMASHDPLVYRAGTVDRLITLRDGRLQEEE